VKRLLRFARIFALSRSPKLLVAAARQRASREVADFLGSGARYRSGSFHWNGLVLGGPNFDLLTLPYIVAMHQAGAEIRAERNGWHIRLPQGPVFYFDDLDLLSGLSVVKERFVDHELVGFDVDGAVVLDIGAHFGDSAVWFASHGARRIVAFEPFPQTAAVAAESILLNDLGSVVQLKTEGVGS
jgi:hypothetical protein